MQRVQVGDLSAPQLGAGGGREVVQMRHEFGQMVRALADAQARLEREGDERRRLLLGLQDADKLISIGQLSAGLAHEIGSPLQVLVGRARMLTQRADDAAEVRRNAEILAEQGERITRIVEQLMQFARRQPIALGPVDAPRAVQSVLELLEFEARRHGVRLLFEHADAPATMQADAGQLQQIVFNLVTNALAVAPRGTAIAVELAQVSGDAPQVQLTVRDRGPGVPPEVVDQLFEPFFTTRSQEGGAGLGLAIVRALAQEHGGSVDYAVRPDGGSAFIVNIPLLQP